MDSTLLLVIIIYLMGKYGGARVWMGTMLLITVAMATLYAFF